MRVKRERPEILVCTNCGRKARYMSYAHGEWAPYVTDDEPFCDSLCMRFEYAARKAQQD